MIIPRQKMCSKHDKCDELSAALATITPTARATEGVISFDIARTLDDKDSFIAAAVYDDGAALERQKSAAEVHRAMAIFPNCWRGHPSEPSTTHRSTRRVFNQQ
jgi:quinol monooxygenase YgiN